MKIDFLRLYIFVLMPFSAWSTSFSEMPLNVQSYIVRHLGQKMISADIALIHHRMDEVFRDDENGLDDGVPRILGFEKVRILRVLKGEAVETNSPIYLYEPFAFDGRRIGKTPLYNPFLRSDDMVRLTFVSRQIEPLKGYRGVVFQFDQKHKIHDDAVAMNNGHLMPRALMEKHGLVTVFSNKVYRIEEGCTFQVDYPTPKMEKTSFELYNPHISLEKGAERMRAAELIFKLIHLSAREASEIVFIAYLQDGEDGIARYAEVAKDDPLLVPMTKPEFQTELGKRLYAAVTAPPGVETEPEEAHHHHHPEMSEAERLAWVPPPNTNSNGNVWAYLNPKKEVQTIEFFTDGEVRTGKDGKNTAIFQWFKKDGVVEANSARWLQSPDGKSIFEESNGFPDMRFLQRVWHRGCQPPPPDPKLAEALTEEGMRWVSEKGETSYVFNADGTCRENRRPYTPRATWEPWYGRTICIRHTGRSVDPVLAYISPDGTILSREGGDVYRKRPAEEDEKE